MRIQSTTKAARQDIGERMFAAVRRIHEERGAVTADDLAREGFTSAQIIEHAPEACARLKASRVTDAEVDAVIAEHGGERAALRALLHDLTSLNEAA